MLSIAPVFLNYHSLIVLSNQLYHHEYRPLSDNNSLINNPFKFAGGERGRRFPITGLLLGQRERQVRKLISVSLLGVVDLNHTFNNFTVPPSAFNRFSPK
jgi:hypothetical protein